MSNSLLIAFIAQLVNRHFLNCSLLLLSDNFGDKYFEDERTSDILERTKVPKYSLSYPTDQLDKEASSWISFHPPPRLTNVRRHSSQCMLSALLLNQVSADFTQVILDTISPTFMPITRKDVDYFMFVAKPEIHEELMRTPTLGSKLKFKTAVGVSSGKVVVTTMDFFGGPNGSQKLMELPNQISENEETMGDMYPDFIVNLRGHTLQITIPLSLSLVEANPRFGGPWVGVKNAKRGRWKYCIEDYLMIKYNFTYRFFPSTGPTGLEGHGGTGKQLVNGTWIGVTGDLYYGRADLGLGIANTDHRIHVISFTDAIFDLAYLTFVTGLPSKVYSPLAMLWPFDTSLWMTLIACTIAIMVFFYGVTKLMQRFHLEDATLSNAYIQILLIVAPYLEQDSPIGATSTPLRAFLALWMFFIMIITTLYRSKLTTLLAFPVLESLPNTFDALAHSDLQVGFMKVGDASYNTLTRSKEPVYLLLTSRWEVMPGPSLECLDKVVSQKRYACILYDFDVVYLANRNMSDADTRKLKYSNAVTYNVYINLALQPQSIYRVNFGKTMEGVMPFDLATRWNTMDLYDNVRKPKLKWWAETNQLEEKTKREEEGDDSNLTLQNIKGVFYVFFCCLAASLIAFSVEFCRCPLLLRNRKSRMLAMKTTGAI